MIKPVMVMMFLDSGFNRTASQPNINLSTLTGDAITPDVLRARLSLMGWRKLETFLSGMPAILMLCLDSILLMYPAKENLQFPLTHQG
jgi:hypothetical protein